MKYSFILLSAGSGRRMGGELPKQYMILGGKPVLLHTIERLQDIDEISEIIIVAAKEFFGRIKSMIDNRRLKKPYSVVEGGATRQASVLCGLKAAREDNVIIHEAARPFVKRGEFMRLINEQNINAIYGASINFTVLEGGDYIENLLERSRLINIQLPQKFARGPLLDAHLKAEAEGRVFTEDACLLFNYTGADIRVLRGTEYNIKLTAPVDMIIGEQIYKDYILNGEV